MLKALVYFFFNRLFYYNDYLLLYIKKFKPYSIKTPGIPNIAEVIIVKIFIPIERLKLSKIILRLYIRKMPSNPFIKIHIKFFIIFIL
jgi:hypothetical protein